MFQPLTADIGIMAIGGSRCSTAAVAASRGRRTEQVVMSKLEARSLSTAAHRSMRLVKDAAVPSWTVVRLEEEGRRKGERRS
jgi:hypothetical protein